MATHRSRLRRAAGFGRTARNFVLFLLFVAVLSGAAAGALLYWEIAADLPDVDTLTHYRPPVATQVLADDGTVIAEFYFEKRYLVPIERIPAVVRNAFIAAEDGGFYEHGGVEPLSILRAFINNALAGGKVQGGSTITQQVVKLLLLSPQKNYERKLKEILLALRLERQLSKDEILSLYLNHLYLGSGAYGVAAAAQEYFGKRIEELSLPEAALLAGLPQAPSRYSPFKHWPRAKARQQYVLERMVDVHFITRQAAAQAVEAPIALASRTGNVTAAPSYVEHVRRMLEDKYGDRALYALGLRVHTAVNLAMQRTAEEVLRAGLRELAARQGYGGVLRHVSAAEVDELLRRQREALNGAGLQAGRVYEALVTGSERRGPVRVQVGPFRGILQPAVERTGSARASYGSGDVIRVRLAASATEQSYEFEPDDEPAVQGALIALEPATGVVQAMVGGYSFDSSQFNRAVQGARQPGSAFKPFIYAAALDRGFTPASIIVDEPIFFWDHESVWIPHNYEDEHFGPTSLRDALTFSRNVVSVKIAEELGIPYIIEYLQPFGFRSPLGANRSLALGSSEVTLLELAAAYTAFANLGTRAEPLFIRRITDSQGKVIEEKSPQTARVLSAETAYLITNILQGVIARGTGHRARGLGRPAAGKTGTTNDMNDAWFIGYTPQLLAGLWVGFDETRSLGRNESGGRVAAPIWLRFMQQSLKGAPVREFPVPAGIKCVLINPLTGHRAASGDAGSVLECFRHGTEPRHMPVQEVRVEPESAREFFVDSATTGDVFIEPGATQHIFRELD